MTPVDPCTYKIVEKLWVLMLALESKVRLKIFIIINKI